MISLTQLLEQIIQEASAVDFKLTHEDLVDFMKKIFS
jgi:hypothetical protein